MKLRFLGTGTSSGVPMIGCRCRVCLSKNPHDKRLRCASLISYNNKNLLIDAGPDIRYQLLCANIPSIDGILITHPHFDHIIGLDEMRPFSWQKPIPIYSDINSQNMIKNIFPYLFDQTNIQIGGGLTQLELKTLTPYTPFVHDNLEILPITVMHGKLPIIGYKFNNTAYITDIKTLPAQSMAAVKNVDTLILGCLREQIHSTHINRLEALELIEQINPKQTYLIHMNHELLAEEWQNLLPKNTAVAYDSLEIIL